MELQLRKKVTNEMYYVIKRVGSEAIYLQPRKNEETTVSALFSLYFCLFTFVLKPYIDS